MKKEFMDISNEQNENTENININNISTNRNHKDRLFIKLFGMEETKENLLELYNALNDTDHTDVNDLTLTTIDNVIYMGYKHDVSFLISDDLVLYEHQSSYDVNIVIRGLIYFTKQLEKYFALQGIQFPTSRKVMIPEPRFYVLYNGEEKADEEIIMKLLNVLSGKLLKTASSVE